MDKILIFGTGSGAKKFYSFLDKSDCEIIGFLDNDEKKWGKYFDNYLICI